MKKQKQESELVAEYATGWHGRGDLGSLLAELERQKESKIDFVADMRHLRVEAEMVSNPNGSSGYRLRLIPTTAQTREWLGRDGLPFKMQALKQLGSARLLPAVPVSFTQSLGDMRPERLAHLFSALLQDTGKRVLVRCLDGNVRAVLSDQYRVLDNFDVAFSAMEQVQNSGGQVIEANLTDNNMRIKFTSREIVDTIMRKREDGNWDYAGGLGNQEFLSKVAARAQGDLPGGGGNVHPLATISNSETGHGRFNVRLGILAAICYNLATVDQVVGRAHIGSRMPEGVFQPDTIATDNKVIFMKIRDSLRAAFNQEQFAKIVAKIRTSQEEQIEDPTSAMKNVVRDERMTDEQRESILEYFLRDYDQTRYGLAQAISRSAQDTDNADNAESLEDCAGRVMTGKALATAEI